MAPHSGFKLAVIRTMRCDTCNKGNVNGLQECVNCNMHFCRECIESGKLDNDEKHRMNQNAIATLDWDKAAKGRRASNRRETTVSKPVSHDVPAKEQRREARRAERHLRHETRHSGAHHESAPHFQGPQDPRVQMHMGAFPSSGFNILSGTHDHAGHGNFPYAPVPPGYPPGYAPSPPEYAPSLPAHAMPYGAPPSGPGQYGQQPRQGGGLAMPFGLMYGNHLPVNSGMPPRGDPRLNTPPGPQFAPSGYPVPNNFGGYYGGGPLEYTPAPTPPGFPGQGFHQPPSQPQPMYNDRGYVSRGNIPTGQPVSGPSHPSGRAFGQPYGGGALPHAPPPQGQPQTRGREGEPAQGGTAPHFAEPARESRAREPTSQAHAEQPADSLAIQRQQQQQAWEREQARQAWEQEKARKSWERQQAQQAQQALQQMWELSKQQPTQQNAQPVAQQQQSQEPDEHKAQPAPQRATQTAQEGQQQDDQRQERQGGQNFQQQAVRPISDGGPASGPAAITASPFTLPPIVTPTVTAPRVTLPPITTPPIAAPSVQQAQTPVSNPAPPPSCPEADTASQLRRLQLRQTVIVPTVVEHARRPFGIPALARDMYAGRPNHYDETAARWAQSQQVRAKRIREYDEDDYDDYEDDETDDDATQTDPAIPGSPSGTQPPPPPRGQKRTRSRAASSSSVDSTLSAELDPDNQPAAAAGGQRPVEDELVRELYHSEDIRRARRVGGELAALDMAAAANTLRGDGLGLIGAGRRACMDNDAMLMRRKLELGREWPGEVETVTGEPAEKKQRRAGSGSGDGVPGGEAGGG